MTAASLSALLLLACAALLVYGSLDAPLQRTPGVAHAKHAHGSAASSSVGQPQPSASLHPTAPATHPESHANLGARPRFPGTTRSPLPQEDASSAAAPAKQRARAAGACTPKPYDFGDYDYCEAGFLTSSSYSVPTPVSGFSWSLRNVQLITRHGDRTPVNILPSYDVSYPFCGRTQSLGFYAQNAAGGEAEAERVRGVPARRRVAEEGANNEGRRLERIPVLSPPSVANPYASELWQGNCMTGQLTSIGVQQLTDIGGNLRDIYVNLLGFLPADYSRANTSFYLRTTDVWRTRQSAESLLQGLWPALDLDAEVIPLHSYPAEIETMYANPLACDALARVMLAQSQEPAWLAHLDVPAVWAELDQVLGTGALPDWHAGFDHQSDNFHTRQCHELPLPCEPSNPTNCINQTLADFVHQQGSWEYAYLMNESPLATQLAQLGMGAFMSVLRDLMLAHVSNDPAVSSVGAPDMAYYSGHDTTIGAVLGALNVTGMQWPPYASNLLFELWEQVPQDEEVYEEETPETAAQPAAASSFSVRIIYNGAVLPLYAAGCCDDLCPWDNVLAYLDTMIPENLVELCTGDGIRKQIKHR